MTTEFDELKKNLDNGQAPGWFRDLIREELRKVGFAAALAAAPLSRDSFDGRFEKDSVGVITPAQFGIGGHFLAHADNPDGSFDRTSLRAAYAKNMVVNGALNDILDVYLNSGTQKTAWYLGLINDSGFSSLAAGDTISSHGGWTELTSYSQSTRPTWTPSSASGQTITNPSAATFTINTATVAINGCFLVSNSTKGGSTGVLFATGSFASVQNLVNGQNLLCTYSCPASAT